MIGSQVPFPATLTIHLVCDIAPPPSIINDNNDDDKNNNNMYLQVRYSKHTAQHGLRPLFLNRSSNLPIAHSE
jgi:hypothetical protein